MAKYSYRNSGYIRRNMPASSSDLVEAHLNNLLNRSVFKQLKHYVQIGLRQRILGLKLMLASGINAKINKTVEDLLCRKPRKVSQQALEKRFLAFPAAPKPMKKSALKNKFAGIGAMVAAVSIGYFGVQYVGRNTMIGMSAGMILSAVAYLTEKWLSSQQLSSKTPVVIKLQPKSIHLNKKLKNEHFSTNQNDATANCHPIVEDSRLIISGVNLTKAASISKSYSYCRRRLSLCHRAKVESSTKTPPKS